MLYRYLYLRLPFENYIHYVILLLSHTRNFARHLARKITILLLSQYRLEFCTSYFETRNTIIHNVYSSLIKFKIRNTGVYLKFITIFSFQNYPLKKKNGLISNSCSYLSIISIEAVKMMRLRLYAYISRLLVNLELHKLLEINKLI